MNARLKGLPIARGKLREFLLHERQKYLLSGRRQVERAAAQSERAMLLRRAGHAVQVLLAIRDARHDGVRIDSHAHPGRAQLLDSLQPKLRPGCAWESIRTPS